MSTYVYMGPRIPQGSPEEKHSFSIYKWDEESGSLIFSSHVPGNLFAGHVVTDLEHNLLYVSDEVSANPELGMGGGGRIFTFAIDPATGSLTKIEDVLSFGGHPSYLALDPDKKYMITTHFCPMPPVPKVSRDENGKYIIQPMHGDTTVVLRHINPDGSLGEVCDVLYVEPEGDRHPLNPSHMHCVVPSPDGSIFIACDMGQSKIYAYRIDKENNRLEIIGGHGIDHIPGCGSRYCAFHPTKPWVFINCEHKTIISSFKYTAQGSLEELCTASCIDDSCSAKGLQASDMNLSADGKFIYNCIRGSNTISVLAVDQENGALELIQSYKMQGVKPRSCALSPGGKYLIVANTDSNLIEVIAVGEDGRLSPTDNSVSDAFPGTLTFVTI